ncbi:MAG TPA: peptide chain release factor N(5)-glutamine methyltransferase [Thermomicrobiales bacterium]
MLPTKVSTPRLRDLLARGTDVLRRGGIETPELDAALLLGHLLGRDRAALYAHLLDDAPPGIPDAFDALIERRSRREPVAYLTGAKEFMGLAFAVSAAVLVPRPETELLVEWAACWLVTRPHGARVVDVGTGSGAIAISLASMTTHTRIFASDISREALEVARLNARRHMVADRVAFVCGDLVSWLGRPVTMILANLPYLTDAQTDAADLRAEPRGALAGGGGDGFRFYRTLIPQIPGRLALDGACAFEIDPSQAAIATALCAASFPAASVAIHHDLAGLARFVTVETAVS